MIIRQVRQGWGAEPAFDQADTTSGSVERGQRRGEGMETPTNKDHHIAYAGGQIRSLPSGAVSSSIALALDDGRRPA